ncbi:hypothetical protein HNP46_000362 [Pseudomonas nitritireducens]|uniref:Uncharacterized protein n=1 Tax=Pseudomonas nitroreducens TaxID=46680 RepID=A0A7W7KEV2_PSENT|nr:hypothetical protein [Pseudomonas nitritireducens]MBB4861551.1 hypothetical protein [Pseudomonas nitritireducens]
MVGSVTREKLFGADEFASDWATHQQARIDRVFDIKAKQAGVPKEMLRLCFSDRRPTELINRQGHRTVYTPAGIVTDVLPASRQDSHMTFMVEWVDPWGFPHREERNFLEIQFCVVDQMAFSRQNRIYQSAKTRLKGVI